MFDTDNKVIWHTVLYFEWPFFVFVCGVVIIHRSWKRLLRTQATSQRWRLTVLLICYISLLTRLPVWANTASKRRRLPLSTHAADWLSFPSTSSRTPLRQRWIVPFILRCRCNMKKVHSKQSPTLARESILDLRCLLTYLCLFTWGFYDLCSTCRYEYAK